VKAILDQLTQTNLLPSSLTAAIQAGATPPTSEVGVQLVICAMDAEAIISGDPTSTWNERRLSRQLLAVAFLVALCGENKS
jgi:hypothetical protein